MKTPKTPKPPKTPKTPKRSRPSWLQKHGIKFARLTVTVDVTDAHGAVQPVTVLGDEKKVVVLDPRNTLRGDRANRFRLSAAISALLTEWNDAVGRLQ